MPGKRVVHHEPVDGALREMFELARFEAAPLIKALTEVLEEREQQQQQQQQFEQQEQRQQLEHQQPGEQQQQQLQQQPQEQHGEQQPGGVMGLPHVAHAGGLSAHTPGGVAVSLPDALPPQSASCGPSRLPVWPLYFGLLAGAYGLPVVCKHCHTLASTAILLHALHTHTDLQALRRFVFSGAEGPGHCTDALLVYYSCKHCHSLACTAHAHRPAGPP